MGWLFSFGLCVPPGAASIPHTGKCLVWSWLLLAPSPQHPHADYSGQCTFRCTQLLLDRFYLCLAGRLLCKFDNLIFFIVLNIKIELFSIAVPVYQVWNRSGSEAVSQEPGISLIPLSLSHKEISSFHSLFDGCTIPLKHTFRSKPIVQFSLLPAAALPKEMVMVVGHSFGISLALKSCNKKYNGMILLQTPVFVYFWETLWIRWEILCLDGILMYVMRKADLQVWKAVRCSRIVFTCYSKCLLVVILSPSCTEPFYSLLIS